MMIWGYSWCIKAKGQYLDSKILSRKSCLLDTSSTLCTSFSPRTNTTSVPILQHLDLWTLWSQHWSSSYFVRSLDLELIPIMCRWFLLRLCALRNVTTETCPNDSRYWSKLSNHCPVSLREWVNGRMQKQVKVVVNAKLAKIRFYVQTKVPWSWGGRSRAHYLPSTSDLLVRFAAGNQLPYSLLVFTILF